MSKMVSKFWRERERKSSVSKSLPSCSQSKTSINSCRWLCGLMLLSLWKSFNRVKNRFTPFNLFVIHVQSKSTYTYLHCFKLLNSSHCLTHAHIHMHKCTHTPHHIQTHTTHTCTSVTPMTTQCKEYSSILQLRTVPPQPTPPLPHLFLTALDDLWCEVGQLLEEGVLVPQRLRRHLGQLHGCQRRAQPPVGTQHIHTRLDQPDCLFNNNRVQCVRPTFCNSAHQHTPGLAGLPVQQQSCTVC